MRYALYFTPAKTHALTQTAASWLGRDAFTATTFSLEGQGALDPATHDALTVDPRRYGFHATLKAPFELAEGLSEQELLDALEVFCRSTEAFDIPVVQLGRLGAFFALVPDGHTPALADFAGSVVRTFEPFRAPLSEADIARRKPDSLSDKQRYNLINFGYPYVFDEFRFHMTLTGPVPDPKAQGMAAAIDHVFRAFIGQPLSIDGLALFVERDRGAPFLVHSWLPLAAAQKNG